MVIDYKIDNFDLGRKYINLLYIVTYWNSDGDIWFRWDGELSHYMFDSEMKLYDIL